MQNLQTYLSLTMADNAPDVKNGHLSYNGTKLQSTSKMGLFAETLAKWAKLGGNKQT